MRRFVSGAAIVLVVSLTAGACAKKAPDPPPPAPAPPKVPSDDEIYTGMTPEEIAKKYLSDVFFELDSVDLSEEGRANLQKNLQWLNRWTSTRIMIEGHADSRGTNEYNLALGERRADAVRDYLVSLGLSGDRVTIVSKGEEQPFCSEESESCWQQNRRGHFIITAK